MSATNAKASYAVVNPGTSAPQTYARGEYGVGVDADLTAEGKSSLSRYYAGPWEEAASPLPAAGPAAGVGRDAVVYLPRTDSGARHVLYGVNFGYGTTPTNGSFRVESPSGTTVFGPIPVPAAGPQGYAWDEGLRGARGADMMVVLNSGAGAVSGCVSVPARGYGG